MEEKVVDEWPIIKISNWQKEVLHERIKFMNLDRWFGNNWGEPGMSCQGLINKKLLGECEGSSGLLLPFLGNSTRKSSQTKTSYSAFYLHKVHCIFLRGWGKHHRAQIYSLVVPFSTSEGDIYVFAKLSDWIPSQCFRRLGLVITSIHSNGKTGKERVVRVNVNFFLF